MPFVTPETLLSDIILSDCSLIPVLNRFDIELGVGDLTVAAAGESHPDIETDFLVSILNTCLSDDYFPEHALKEFQTTTIIRYLRETYAYYTLFALANIERHFNALIAASGSDNNLSPMRKFFDTTKHAFQDLKERDEKVLFSSVDSLSDDEAAEAAAETRLVEEYLDDLTNMLVIHLRGQVDNNLLYAVIQSTIAFADDFSKNARIRNRILLNVTI